MKMPINIVERSPIVSIDRLQTNFSAYGFNQCSASIIFEEFSKFFI